MARPLRLECAGAIYHACLLPNDNHYHLLVETVEGNLSRDMRQFTGQYTQQFNRQHKMIGHLFQGRYKAIIVQKEIPIGVDAVRGTESDTRGYGESPGGNAVPIPISST